MTNDPVVDLQTRIAFLEKTIGELDAVLGELYGQVEAMRDELGQVRAAISRPIETSSNPVDEKPPHW